jgi:DNA-3-methyladenine glycosylase II
MMPQGSGTAAGAVAGRAVRHLRRADPIMAGLIRQVGRCRFELSPSDTHFEALARSIVYQQLSGAAAGTIYSRVRTALRTVAPASILAASDQTLRTAGLSGRKLSYLRHLATRSADGSLPVERLHELSDEDVIRTLSAVKGVGRWTAQMFLIFRLGRPDVLPELDLGVRKAVQRSYRMRSLPSVKRLTRLGVAWAPYRTYASWYLWRSLEL